VQIGRSALFHRRRKCRGDSLDGVQQTLSLPTRKLIQQPSRLVQRIGGDATADGVRLCFPLLQVSVDGKTSRENR
jgi:hypothetical protein